VGCLKVSKLPRGLETKQVFDWDHRPLGTVLGSEQGPGTSDSKRLIVGLSADARAELDTDKDTIVLPFDFVEGIRRDEVRLDRAVGEIARTLPGGETVEAPDGEETVLEIPA
jgi:hypothetical protein